MWNLQVDCIQHCTCFVEIHYKMEYKRTLNCMYRYVDLMISMMMMMMMIMMLLLLLLLMMMMMLMLLLMMMMIMMLLLLLLLIMMMIMLLLLLLLLLLMMMIIMMMSTFFIYKSVRCLALWIIWVDEITTCVQQIIIYNENKRKMK